MKVLDCESFFTTLSSLETITQVKQANILSFLNNFDMDDFYYRNPLYLSGDKLLLLKFREKFDPVMSYDQSNWFHLTRLYKNDDFESGILPLVDVVDEKWDILYSLTSDKVSLKEWADFRSKMEMGALGPHSSLYKFRMSNTDFKGPYAISIKDTAFVSDQIRNHNYLAVPEIIRDICICFEQTFNIDLFKEYSKNSVPCIVKFKTEFSNPDLIGNVLMYIYQTIHEKALNSNCKINYNANGNKIPPEDILKIEYVDKCLQYDPVGQM